MPRFRLVVAVAALIPSMPLCAQRFTLKGSDAAVYNLVGSIRVQGAASGDIEVSVTRKGDDASKLKVESGVVHGRESVRVIYPSDRIVFRGNGSRRSWSGGRTQVHVNDDGTFGDDRGRGDGWWGRDRVEIVSSGRGLDASADVTVSVPRGKSLRIALAAGDATIDNVDGDLDINVWAADVTTSHTRGELKLDTGSGETSVTDANGDVMLDSGSGGVTLSQVKGSHLTIDSGSGRVRADGIAVERLNIDSGSGSIDLRDVAAPDIVLDSGSGSVGLDLKADVETMRIDSGSGSVSINVPESLGAELEARQGAAGSTSTSRCSCFGKAMILSARSSAMAVDAFRSIQGRAPCGCTSGSRSRPKRTGRVLSTRPVLHASERCSPYFCSAPAAAFSPA
ncbi:MAG: DUF4097 family beta strand repeat-containing protein [Gemmatimonadaceae bacterium]